MSGLRYWVWNVLWYLTKHLLFVLSVNVCFNFSNLFTSNRDTPISNFRDKMLVVDCQYSCNFIKVAQLYVKCQVVMVDKERLPYRNNTCIHWISSTLVELWNFRSRERKYHGMELSLPGTFAPRSESSKNFCSHAKWLSIIGADSMGAIAPTAKKLWGAMPSSCPHRNFDAIFETVKCSVKL